MWTLDTINFFVFFYTCLITHTYICFCLHFLSLSSSSSSSHRCFLMFLSLDVSLDLFLIKPDFPSPPLSFFPSFLFSLYHLVLFPALMAHSSIQYILLRQRALLIQGRGRGGLSTWSSNKETHLSVTADPLLNQKEKGRERGTHLLLLLHEWGSMLILYIDSRPSYRNHFWHLLQSEIMPVFSFVNEFRTLSGCSESLCWKHSTICSVGCLSHTLVRSLDTHKVLVMLTKMDAFLYHEKRIIPLQEEKKTRLLLVFNRVLTLDRREHWCSMSCIQTIVYSEIYILSSATQVHIIFFPFSSILFQKCISHLIFTRVTHQSFTHSFWYCFRTQSIIIIIQIIAAVDCAENMYTMYIERGDFCWISIIIQFQLSETEYNVWKVVCNMHMKGRRYESGSGR
ncbi:hypothetical protein VP01_2783g1 [Puccinia sorghi]|uniref:Uncharacterized protein n=1 Tax=Puccinia sorghi TaxID=27349 RepID=A0A0L6V2Q9_9BASI|nr:hypothetical protein VP01_2783g1 [Puccinia sorghi]